jgi:hypothetical protein
MTRRPLLLAAALSVLTACAGSVDLVAQQASGEAIVSRTQDPSPASSGSSPSPSAIRGHRIHLTPLPPQGLVVDSGKGVRFVDLRGHVVADLPGFHLEYPWMVPGRVVLRSRPHVFFVLRVDANVLVPIGDASDAVHVGQQFQDGFGPEEDPGLPWPSRSKFEGTRTGFWAYALRSPDGTRLLAQWSGECEVPNAFFIEGDRVVTVDGFQRIAPASDSWALGWTRDNRAVVTLAGGACSSPFARPGVYLLDGPGNGELLTPGEHAARLWNPA